MENIKKGPVVAGIFFVVVAAILVADFFGESKYSGFQISPKTNLPESLAAYFVATGEFEYLEDEGPAPDRPLPPRQLTLEQIHELLSQGEKIFSDAINSTKNTSALSASGKLISDAGSVVIEFEKSPVVEISVSLPEFVVLGFDEGSGWLPLGMKKSENATGSVSISAFAVNLDKTKAFVVSRTHEPSDDGVVALRHIKNIKISESDMESGELAVIALQFQADMPEDFSLGFFKIKSAEEVAENSRLPIVYLPLGDQAAIEIDGPVVTGLGKTRDGIQAKGVYTVMDSDLNRIPSAEGLANSIGPDGAKFNFGDVIQLQNTEKFLAEPHKLRVVLTVDGTADQPAYQTVLADKKGNGLGIFKTKDGVLGFVYSLQSESGRQIVTQELAAPIDNQKYFLEGRWDGSALVLSVDGEEQSIDFVGPVLAAGKLNLGGDLLGGSTFVGGSIQEASIFKSVSESLQTA